MNNVQRLADKTARLADGATPGPVVSQCTPTGPHGQMIYRNAIISKEYPNHTIMHRANPADDGYDAEKSFNDALRFAHALNAIGPTTQALLEARKALGKIARHPTTGEYWMDTGEAKTGIEIAQRIKDFIECARAAIASIDALAGKVVEGE